MMEDLSYNRHRNMFMGHIIRKTWRTLHLGVIESLKNDYRRRIY